MKKILISLAVFIGMFIVIGMLPDRTPLKDSAQATVAHSDSGPLHDKSLLGLIVLSGGDIGWARKHMRGIGVTKQGSICYQFKGSDGDYHSAWWDGASMVVDGTAGQGCEGATPLNEAE
ncbi:MAG: hypothetical protein WCC59_15120 [Terriglobales bacterium]